MELTKANLSKIFYYENGSLFWKVNISPKIKMGTRCGGFSSGYRCIKYEGKTYYEHKLIFCLIHDKYPQFVDHIDRDKLNNNIFNLRESTRFNNAANRTSAFGSSSKYLGVTYNKSRNTYEVTVRSNKKTVYFKRFKSEQEAALSYNKIAALYHGEFANLNIID